MYIIFYAYLIPRFNWSRERRLFNNFVHHLSAKVSHYQMELDDVGRGKQNVTESRRG